MNVTVQINLTGTESLSKSAQSLSEEILTAVGGAVGTDSCSVTIVDTGSVYPTPPTAMVAPAAADPTQATQAPVPPPPQ